MAEAATAAVGPRLARTLQGQHTKGVNAINYVTATSTENNDEAIISTGDDCQLLVWLLRDNGEFWPSVHKELQDSGTALCYNPATRKLFVGLSSGLLTIYSMAQDWNSLTVDRTFRAHDGRIVEIEVDADQGLVLSCGRDSKVVAHKLSDGSRAATFTMRGPACSMQYAAGVRTCFVGDHTGRIHIQKIVNKDSFKSIAVLEGHRRAVTALHWEQSNEHLYSGGEDKLVVDWDIGKCKGERFELRGHRNKIKSLAYDKASQQLLSCEEKCVIAWDMSSGRRPNPVWRESDACEMQDCQKPFMWNVQQMWEDKKIGGRQHHCRSCGKAVCDDCCAGSHLLATMGHETKVRLCKVCKPKLTEADGTRRAKVFECSWKTTALKCLLPNHQPMYITSNPEGAIQMWDIQSEVLEGTGTSVAIYREKTSLTGKAESFFGNFSFAKLLGDDDGGNDDDDDQGPVQSSPGNTKAAMVYRLGGDDDEDARPSLLDSVKASDGQESDEVISPFS